VKKKINALNEVGYEQISIIENCSVESVKKQFLDLLRRLKTQTN